MAVWIPQTPLSGLMGLTLFLALLVLAGVSVRRARALTRSATRARQRYQALLDNLPGIVLRVEGQAPWRIHMASRRVGELLGTGPLALLGQPLTATALAPDDGEGRARLEQCLHTLDGRSPGGELTYRYRHPDGSLRWFEANVRPATTHGRNGQPELDLLLQDVTERQRERQRLQVAQSIIQGSRDAIVSKTLDGIVTSWNAGATEVFGYSAEEAIGMPITRLFRPQDLHQEVELMARIRQNLDVPPFDAVRVRKDGRLVHVSVSLSPTLDEAGHVIGASKIARDIGERVLNEALRRDVAHAEQMAATRTAFLARMSHELRTPMTAVLGFGSLLLQSPLSDEQREQMLAMQRSAQHLLGLLDDVLDTARLDKGELVLNPEPFSLPDLLAEVHAQFDPTAAGRQLGLEISSAPGTPAHFLGDPQRVRQILFNLVDNAIKFTRSGQVRVLASQEGGQLRLDVIDTGVGMSAEQLERVFEPFNQADTSLSRAFGGTGLGTTLCRQLAHLMGGEIQATSQPGEGSRFTVRLPLPVLSNAPFPSLEPHMPLATTLPRPDPDDSTEIRWIDEQAGPAIWGGLRDVWLDALRQFDIELDDHLVRIRDTLQGTDASAALQAVHALRGATASVALPALFERLDSMETRLRAGELVEAATHLDALDRDALRTRRQIVRLNSAPAPWVVDPTPSAIDSTQALAQLAQLREQLARSEVPSQALATLKRALGGQQPAQPWQQLCSALDSFEYDRALEPLGALENWLHSLRTPQEQTP